MTLTLPQLAAAQQQVIRPNAPTGAPVAPLKPSIVEKILPDSCWGYDDDARHGMAVQFIVNHIAEGYGSLFGWFLQSGLSTHFWVGQDGTIEQYVPLEAAAYGQGIVSAGSDFPAGYPGNGPDYNRMAVSIEREGKAFGDADADEPSDAQWSSIVALNGWLAYTYALPLDDQHIVGHYRSDHVNRSRCPSSRSMDAPAYMSRLLESLKATTAGAVAPQTDAWSHWSAETIARATSCPVDAVRENWPLLYAELDKRGISDAPVCAAVIGTVAVETASTFAPVPEYGPDGPSWPD
jgi:hypothetical protein